MVALIQLVLGKTGCVSYIIHCEKKNEATIVDAFQGFEDVVEKKLRAVGSPSVKYVIDTHTHADRRSASKYFSDKYKTKGIVKSGKTKYTGSKIATNDDDVLKVGDARIDVLFTPGHTYDHNSYLVDNHSLLVGDCLFIGDV